MTEVITPNVDVCSHLYNSIVNNIRDIRDDAVRPAGDYVYFEYTNPKKDVVYAVYVLCDEKNSSNPWLTMSENKVADLISQALGKAIEVTSESVEEEYNRVPVTIYCISDGDKDKVILGLGARVFGEITEHYNLEGEIKPDRIVFDPYKNGGIGMCKTELGIYVRESIRYMLYKFKERSISRLFMKGNVPAP